MTDDDNDNGELIRGLREGDPDVLRRFFHRYGPMLQQVAAKHLVPGIRRRVGPETIAQSACRSFLRRAQAGEFELADSDGLWRLLCAITLTKVKEHVRFHRRQRRNIDREQGLAPSDETREGAGLDPADPHPAPDDAVAFQEQFDRLLDQFDPDERQVVELKLQNLTNEQVAAQMGCSERTVRRMLKQVKGRLQSNISDR